MAPDENFHFMLTHIINSHTSKILIPFLSQFPNYNNSNVHTYTLYSIHKDLWFLVLLILPLPLFWHVDMVVVPVGALHWRLELGKSMGSWLSTTRDLWPWRPHRSIALTVTWYVAHSHTGWAVTVKVSLKDVPLILIM